MSPTRVDAGSPSVDSGVSDHGSTFGSSSNGKSINGSSNVNKRKVSLFVSGDS